MLPEDDHSDEDDDYEGYFLQPVNSYNIAERIILANKELFETQLNDDYSTYEGKPRRVTFCDELEEYEPIYDVMSDYVSSDLDEDSNIMMDKVNSKTDEVLLCENNEPINNSNSTDTISNNENSIDEICEEIAEINIQEESIKSNNYDGDSDGVDGVVAVVDGVVGGDGSDCVTENSYVHKNNNTNFSDKKIENNKIIININNINNNNNIESYSSTESNSTIINEMYSTNNDENTIRSGTNNNNNTNVQILLIHSNNVPPPNNNKKFTKINNKKIIDSKLLNLQLNCRACCEYKYLENEQLPRYSGYISQYGLSKEQLEKRERRREYLRRRKFEQQIRKFEEQTYKSEINENAFAKWIQSIA